MCLLSTVAIKRCINNANGAFISPGESQTVKNVQIILSLLMDNRVPYPPNVESRSMKLTNRKQKMIRRFPIAIAATTLALSLTAAASMLGDGQLGQVAEQLKTALAGDPVEVTQKVVLVRLTSSADAMFPSGGWQVPSNVPLLDKMLPTLSKLQNTKIVVAGYTDNVPVGAELKEKGVSNNLDLSAERAVGIANYLASHGVKADLISAHAFGETDPVASNDTPEGQAKNRRVDILLTGDGT
jgi:chemotaxis protein MotB